MRPLKALILSIAISAGGIATSGCVGSAEVAVQTPRLVWVSPGIWVVEDYPHAVYYYDGFYWRVTDGVWYRSDWYTGGFLRVRVTPRAVVRVHQPRRYRRYRPRANVRTRPAVRRKPGTRDRRRR